MSDDPFKDFKFKVTDPNDLPEGFVYRPYIPVQVTPTLLNDEPDAIEKLAATVDPELRAKHEADAAVNRDREKWIADVMERHGRKIQLDPALAEIIKLDDL